MLTLRASLIAFGFVSITLLLMPVQLAFLLMGSRYKKAFPFWYHRMVSRMVGIRVHLTGQVIKDSAVFLICNHNSWSDITVLSSIAPVSFVAKREVASWPFFGWLAKLQRTVFVDRQRRTKTGQTKGEIASRLLQGDVIVLFAEGTSSTGNEVLPFKTSLFAAAELKDHIDNTGDTTAIYVQTASIVYTRRHGLPIGRNNRSIIAWYGEIDLVRHMWGVFKYGPFDVQVHISDPIPGNMVNDRKILAKDCERTVRENVAALLSNS